MSAHEWTRTASGTSLGTEGPQGGIIARDESTPRGVRILLEQDPSRGLYSVSCAIPDWLEYPRFFDSLDQATRAYEAMREALADLADQVPLTRSAPGKPETYEVGAKLTAFMSRFR